MELDSAVWAAIIGAGSGVLSAVITAKLTGSASLAQAVRSDAKNAAYLTSQVAPALRRYAETCLAVTYDDGYSEGRPAGTNGCAEEILSSPTFTPTEFAVEWKALSNKLMLEILTFPEHMPAIAPALDDDDYDDPPDYPAYFNDRQRRHATLGLYALELAERLHVFGMHEESPAGLDLKMRLAERQEELDVEHAEYEKRLLASQARLKAFSLVVPPTPST